MSGEINKCNILFISHVSSKKYGGAERVLDNLISGLDQRRFKTVLLLQESSAENGDLDWDCASSTGIEYYNFGSLKHRFKLFSLLGMSFRVLKACFGIGYLIYKRDIDVVCANTPIAGVFAAIPARLSGKRFVYYEHNLADQRKGH